jgi:HAD superfamily hydrolase (TIGR01549 family)
MFEAVLFDLDDTLLGNPMDTFVPAYFQALTRYLDNLVPPERLITHMMEATEAMSANRSQELTNEEAFASVFYPLLGEDRATVESAFQQFYAQHFPRLRGLTSKRPEARSLVGSALDHGMQVAIATNPMFPRIAVEERLAWAGVPVEQFDYALVTTYENMHATKPHLAYYREILERLGQRPDKCLMVGDSWKMDIAPASSVGLRVFWVTTDNEPPAAPVSLVGQGSLADLWAEVQARAWTL